MIREKLSWLAHPEKAPGWNDFIKGYPTRIRSDGIWWLRYSQCEEGETPDDSQIEIVLAIEILKEMSSFVNDPVARPLWMEGLGRQYWENCLEWSCLMSPEWEASNAFLNFLSYSESMFKLTPVDESLLFPTANLRDGALQAARSIRSGVGIGGKDPNRPYDFFCTNCTAGDSPEWLTDWLGDQMGSLRNPPNFGNGSHSSSGEMQVVFVGGDRNKPDPRHPTFFVILTPNQRDDLCGYNQTCIRPDMPKPDWLDESGEP
jgi:hypothetical protein